MENERMVREYRDMLRNKKSELVGQETIMKNISRRFSAKDSWEIEREIRMTMKETSREIRRLEKRIMKMENEIFGDEDEDVIERDEDFDNDLGRERGEGSSKKVKKENRAIFAITAVVLMVVVLVVVTFVRNFI